MAQSRDTPRFVKVINDDFNKLIQLTRHANLESFIDERILQDEYGRFKLWSRSLAAHKLGTESLDHHLQDSPRLLELIRDVLHELESALYQGA